MDLGWIKLHRQFTGKGYYKNSQYVHLWIHLLLSANHKDEEYMTNGQIITIKAGQFLTGRKKLAHDTGIAEGTVERVLGFLENEHQIEQVKTPKYRLITIRKWDTYQLADTKTNNKRTTNRQLVDTNKNDKNVKKEIHTASASDAVGVSEIIDLFKVVNPSYQTLFGRRSQRDAAQRLLNTHGRERLAGMIAFLPVSNGAKFAPTITTPYELETNMGKLKAWGERQKNAKPNYVI